VMFEFVLRRRPKRKVRTNSNPKMDIFGSDSDTEDDATFGAGAATATALDMYLGSCFLALMKLRPNLKRAARAAAFWKEEGVAIGADLVELLLPRFVAIVIRDELVKDAADAGLQQFEQRLITAGFTQVAVNPSSGSYDAIVHYEPWDPRRSASLAAEYAGGGAGGEMGAAACVLVAGGILLLPCPSHAAQECFPEEHWLSALPCNSMSSLASAAAVGTDTVAARRRGVRVNADAATYWGGGGGADEAGGQQRLSAERELLARITIYPSVAETQLRLLGGDSHRAAVAAMREYGVIVLPGIFDNAQVSAWGTAALADFEEALLRLQSSRNIDLLNPGSNSTRIENFRELGMREALRCDIRNGRRMQRLAAAEAAAEQAAGKDAPRLCRHLRNHPALQSILCEVANPAACDPQAARGNWGRWNFEGGGPEAPPPPLDINAVGAVMSLPGCVDQTIHADTAHLYLHVPDHMPPAYFNLFIPAVQRDRLDGSLLVGQTAFVAGSHKLSVSAKVMCEEGGQDVLQHSLLRPHIQAGDALIFDCRILHFGLSNRTKAMTPLEALSSDAMLAGGLWDRDADAACRALLYINYTQPWFVDPKNWNNNDSLFEGVTENIVSP